MSGLGYFSHLTIPLELQAALKLSDMVGLGKTCRNVVQSLQ